jgi:enoyl-[acyl-carrier-protein] reductase (NADH)
MIKSDSTFHLIGRTTAVLGLTPQIDLNWKITRVLSHAGARVLVGYTPASISRFRHLICEEPQIRGARWSYVNPLQRDRFFKVFNKEGLNSLVCNLHGDNNSLGQSYSLTKAIDAARSHLIPDSSILVLADSSALESQEGLLSVTDLESQIRYLAKSLARHQIRINAIVTQRVDQLSQLQQEEASLLAFYFLCDVSNKITGRIVRISPHFMTGF